MITTTATDNDNHLVEVEVKFLLDDFAALRRRLAQVGAPLVSPRVFERNVRFDTVDERLLARQELLRLRQKQLARA